MTAPQTVASVPQAVSAPSAAYLAGVASLAPLGLNAAVGLQPVFDGLGASGPAGRAAAVALFALGLGLGQPVAGDATDRWGRRTTLLWGLLVASAGALLAAWAADERTLLLGRFVTGLGLSACLVVPRACLRDIHHGAGLQRSMALLSLVFAVVPAVTPLLAWALAQALSWRAPLVVLALMLLLSTLVAWRSHHETRPGNTCVPDWRAWSGLARQRSVQRATLAFAGVAAPFFILAAVGPAGLEVSTGAGPGTVAAVLGATYLAFGLGNLWVRRRAATAGEQHLASGLAIAAFGMLLLAATLAWPVLWLWALALTVYALGHGIVFPAAFAVVLRDAPQRAGLVTAAMGTVHMCSGALSAWVAGSLSGSPHQSAVLMACGMVAMGCLAWLFVPLLKDSS